MIFLFKFIVGMLIGYTVAKIGLSNEWPFWVGLVLTIAMCVLFEFVFNFGLAAYYSYME